jgi:beta-phosphoglucomutase
MNRQKTALVLVDFDGTLFDTRLMNYYSYLGACQSCGFSFPKDKFLREFNGKYYKDFLPKLCHGVTPSQLECIHEKKKELTKTNFDKILLNRQLVSLLEILKNDSYLCVVTTASKETVISVLSFFKLQSLFDCIISGEDVIMHKPNPECYLVAMSRFPNIKKEKIFAFEDSLDGVMAAKKCGVMVFEVLTFSNTLL